jgi:hypothetical protein
MLHECDVETKRKMTRMRSAMLSPKNKNMCKNDTKTTAGNERYNAEGMKIDRIRKRKLGI